MPYDSTDLYQQLLSMIQSPQGVAPAQYDRQMVNVGQYDSSGEETAADAQAAAIEAQGKAYGDAGAAIKKRYDDSKKAQAQYDFLKAQGVNLPDSAKPKGFWESSPLIGAYQAVSGYLNPNDPTKPAPAPSSGARSAGKPDELPYPKIQTYGSRMTSGAPKAEDIQHVTGIVDPVNPVKPAEVQSPSPTSSNTPTGSSVLDLGGPTSGGGTFASNLKKYGQTYQLLFGPSGYFSSGVGASASGAAASGSAAAGGGAAAAGGEAAAAGGAAAAGM